MELAPEERDPTAWPTFPTFRRPALLPIEEISRYLGRHFHHDICEEVDDYYTHAGAFLSRDYCIIAYLSSHFPAWSSQIGDTLFLLRNESHILFF